MARIDPYMGLVIWNNKEDPYNGEQLSNNFFRIGAHDHTNGRGVALTAASFANGAFSEILVKGWNNVTIGTSVSAVSGFQTPGVRFELENEVIRFRGVIEATAAITSGATLLTLPSAFHSETSTTKYKVLSNVEIEISPTTALVKAGAAISSSSILYLDGITINYQK